jgi:hypothetical protein
MAVHLIREQALITSKKARREKRTMFHLRKKKSVVT